MQINYEDSGLIVNYIQMFLKEYYSPFIAVNNTYSRKLQEYIVKFLNSPDSIGILDMLYDLSQYDSGSAERLFTIDRQVEDITLISKMPHPEGYPFETLEDVAWMNDKLESFEEFILERGWHIKNFSYRNSQNKCEIVIAELNKNIIPKSSTIDLLNLYNRSYTEICFSLNSGLNYYFTSLYNFEIKNYEHASTGHGQEYQLCIPSHVSYSIVRTNLGKYNIMKNGDLVYEDFKGFKTFVSSFNIKSNEYYAICIKKPENYQFDPELTDMSIYITFSKEIGSTANVEYSESAPIESCRVLHVSLAEDSPYWQDSEYVFIAICTPEDIDSSYKICVSTFDPDNEIDSVLTFKLNDEFITSDLQSFLSYYHIRLISSEELDSDKFFTTRLIRPAEYYENPYALNEKFLSYILEAIIHNYSREGDIILAQKLASQAGYIVDDTNLGIYDDRLKELISQIQDSLVSKDGTYVEFGKGFLDPDTEAMMSSYIMRGDTNEN